MAYNKTSEERKWNYWKEQEEKKLRELGMEEEKIQKLRQMDREDFLEERRYREHLDETMQDMDSIKEKDSELFARDVKELLDHIGDKRIYELLKETEHKKPISKELAKLLQSSIEYTQEKFGDTEYIFVNEKEPDRPMQYMAIKTKVMSMIQEKQLKDDHGELFGFGTHMFRHYYGVKLTEMHLDDWTIARLLGHKRLNNVQHYRKMSNQRMADETREVRQRMSDIIYMSLARWGEEYEQIRQDD